MLKVSSFAVVFVLAVASLAVAQTEGVVSVGAAVTGMMTTDPDLHSSVAVGPIVRLNPKKGWGVSAALNWFQADIDLTFGGVKQQVGRLRVRPIMAGVGYSIQHGSVMTDFSIVAGPSFNRANLTGGFVNMAAPASVSVRRSFVTRPGVGITYTVAKRVALVGFGGYAFNRPRMSITTREGTVSDIWKADAVVLSAGLVYSLF